MTKWLVAALALSISGGVLAQSSANQANTELLFMIERLQNEVRALRGELEEQRHELERLSSQSRERYIDLDQRILALSERSAQPRNDTPQTSAPQASTPAPTVIRQYRQPDEAERQAYNAIIQKIRQNQAYDEAIGNLYDFISEYPEGDLTINAYYWLGEVYLVKPQIEQARQAFTIVATRYADHRKAPDALYKLGQIHDREGEKEDARRYMDRVVKEYGTSEAATLAKKYLAES